MKRWFEYAIRVGRKEKTNESKKHGFDFVDAWRVLENTESITMHDVKHSQIEQRMITIGMIDDVVCAVVIHTERNGNIRIISFRHANKKEEALLWQ